MGRERLIGQQVMVTFVLNGAIITLPETVDTELNINLKTIEEGYLGETVNRFDDILEGYSGKATLHLSSYEAFLVAQALSQRAQARDPSIIFNVSFRHSFSNGTSAKLLLTDVYMDAIPFKTPKRDEYVNVELSFKCSNLTILT